ncbi:type II toxin-antitoxin system HicB family antitoxin [Noviherbaspirillum cavernae]|uniref:Type II toxin-antitoxin system HicB family antitoxin n=1 Tax=Noviherbaspirillum cavernae TaxID=2320862 RepID=A0A418X1A3_9BURK|nr:type II toxin-antitoxin system HicB family antitoxin [Noviherbaspirillum cavernae]RJG06234.1 type II toxin-antitoxin system HicB family antitoxin [Noviherbaspirillum cavernae]
MRYPVVLTPDGDGFMAAFPDIPEALTSGATEEEALEMAKDALATAMEFYFEDGRPVPLPSKIKRGQQAVDLPASMSAKVLLLNEMLSQKVKPTELARMLDTSPQDVNRLLNLDHATKIDTIEQALRALGKELVIDVR